MQLLLKLIGKSEPHYALTPQLRISTLKIVLAKLNHRSYET